MTEADADRVRAVLAGDRSAFGDLYDRHARWVRALLYDTTRDLTQAQDLAQEVFLRAYRNLRELRNPEQFGSWLMGITRRTAMEWLRHEARGRTEALGDEVNLPASIETGVDAETIQHLREAIASLPERERQAVYVFYLQEQTAEDARSVLNLSRAGLYRVLSRARQRLERIIQRDRENVP